VINDIKTNDKNSIVYIILILIYFFDQTLQTYVSRIFGITIFIFLSYIFFKKNNYKLNKYYFVFVVIFTLYNTLTFTLNFDKCTDYQRIIQSIVLFYLIIYFVLKTNFSFLNDINFLKKFSIVHFLYTIFDFISLNFSLGFKIFNEPSHIALYLSPFLLLSLKKKNFTILNIINLIYILYFHLSLTLLVILLLYILLFNSKKNLIFLLPILLIFLFFNYDGPIIVKFLNSMKILNSLLDYGIIDLNIPHTMSIAVWLNGFSNIFIYLNQTYLLGAGFNLMGCEEYFYNGSFNYLFLDFGKHDIYNANDGSFNLSKIISENGLLGCLVLYFVMKIIINRFFNKPNDLLFIGSIIMLTFLFVRGLNYFSIPFVLTVIMVMKNNLKNNKN